VLARSLDVASIKAAAIAALCKHFHDDGLAAVLAPGFAPKRDRRADRRASRDLRRRGGLEIGEWEVRGDARPETRFHRRTGMTSVVPWLVVSEAGTLNERSALQMTAGLRL
jgi:hypothetical protein